jgi:nitrate/nitrite-specific signal transduction histidine kinase
MSKYQFIFKIISDNQKLEKQKMEEKKKLNKDFKNNSLNYELPKEQFNKDKKLVRRYNEFLDSDYYTEEDNKETLKLLDSYKTFFSMNGK